MADIKRREMRRVHSRMRPSKKKRDRMTKTRAEGGRYTDVDCGSDTATTAGWEMSHSAAGSVTPPSLSRQEFAESVVDLRDLQALLELIQGSE